MADSSFDEGGALYELLGFDAGVVDVLALTPRQIASSYRKQALRWHPDKNPGDAGAAEMLARVFLAHEALSDPDRRAAYDDGVRARRARAAERLALDAGRRRVRDDLLRRERESAAARAPTRATELPADVERRLQREIERLRVDHGLSADVNGAVERQGAAVDAMDESAADAEQASVWEAVPGYTQWRTAEIKFEDLEAAVLARARLLSPSGTGARE
jgi:curved DNA-binding protein CbpA